MSLKTLGNPANTTIPKVLWLTGRWKTDNKNELTKAFQNLQPALNFHETSSESEISQARAEGQRRAEQRFLAWAPPGTEVRYTDNAAMEEDVRNVGQELEAEGVHGVSKAFHSLRAGSFRADLWRLLVLWSRGGVYLDVNLIMKKKLAEVIDFEKDTMVMVDDKGIGPECRKHGAAFWNALMASTARNKYLLASIKAVVQNIERHAYDWCDQTAMTGPTALGNAIGDAFPDFRNHIRIDYEWANPVVRRIGGRGDEFVLCHKDESLHYFLTDKHYTKLWSARAIYCDEKGPADALC
jgi:mannosyltransferase OCH1-like enzyme